MPRPLHPLRALPALAVVCLAACEPSTAPDVVAEGLEPLDPHPEWERIYHEVEACTDREGDFQRVRWFTAEEIRSRADGAVASRIGGLWLLAQGEPHGIAILESLVLEWLLDPSNQTRARVERVIRHEAIHEVLQLPSHRGDVWCWCDGDPSLFEQCEAFSG